MAILHRATLTPTKAELVAAWLDRQPALDQSPAGSGEVEVIGSYRFDDPEGEVGVEALLVRRGDAVLHVPLTYRGAPLDGVEPVGTLDHSVLGPRWVYLADADPVGRACFERALAGEQEEAVMEVHQDGVVVERREPVVRVRREAGDAVGSGEAADGKPRAPRLELVLGEELAGSERLVATWPGGEAVVAAR